MLRDHDESADGKRMSINWEFSNQAIDAKTAKFTNRVEVHAPSAYVKALKARGVPEKAKEVAQRAVSEHNAEETPLFAKDMERKARAGQWR